MLSQSTRLPHPLEYRGDRNVSLQLDDPQEYDQQSTSSGLKNIAFTKSLNSWSWEEATMDRGVWKFWSAVCDENLATEMEGFLAKECSYGKSTLSRLRSHKSSQNITVSPLFTLQVEIKLKVSEKDITSLHQNDPTPCLMCGIVDLLYIHFQVKCTQGKSILLSCYKTYAKTSSVELNFGLLDQ